MLKREATVITGGLSAPGKMPEGAYSIPASECGVGSRLRDVRGSVCEGCYAFKGRYAFGPVQAALYRRFDATMNHPQWVDAMVVLIQGKRHFRWHDSGDIQDVAHLQRIVAVCERTPDTMHWVPTREYRTVAAYRKLHGDFPANLIVRLSAHMVDGDAPDVGLPVSIVVSNGTTPQGFTRCSAPQTAGKCADCRACWTPEVNVAYGLH